VKLANGLTETTTYNARLQPTGIQLGALMTLGYGYSPGNNNGNVASQTITSALTAGGTMTATQTYGYDLVNRLTSVGEAAATGLPAGVTAHPWSLSYDYDPYGNFGTTATGVAMGPRTPAVKTQFSTASNRLAQRTGGAALPADAYDSTGNLQDHPDIGQMTYDGENRLLTYSNGGAVLATYDYDGEGRRVRKNDGVGDDGICVRRGWGVDGGDRRRQHGHRGALSDCGPSGKHAGDHGRQRGIGRAMGLLSVWADDSGGVNGWEPGSDG
jgi:YD repeat-containing protein